MGPGSFGARESRSQLVSTAGSCPPPLPTTDTGARPSNYAIAETHLAREQLTHTLPGLVAAPNWRAHPRPNGAISRAKTRNCAPLPPLIARTLPPRAPMFTRLRPVTASRVISSARVRRSCRGFTATMAPTEKLKPAARVSGQRQDVW